MGRPKLEKQKLKQKLNLEKLEKLEKLVKQKNQKNQNQKLKQKLKLVNQKKLKKLMKLVNQKKPKKLKIQQEMTQLIPQNQKNLLHLHLMHLKKAENKPAAAPADSGSSGGG